ncbi:MAG: formylglycine-generating enzyme family protein, partial [Planctomycetota bacterium]|nr:formylglycine-generating enzyme family protein [Planctomycetota bacterium]
SLGSIKPWALRDNSRNDGAAITCAVGSYLPNPWGLHDMHGNVKEWCEDVFGKYYKARVEDPKVAGSGKDRVLRGGSFHLPAHLCRSAAREKRHFEDRNDQNGFRVVLVPHVRN